GRVIWRGFARRPDHQTNRSIETGCWSGRLAARTGEPSDDRTTTGPLSTLLLLAAVVGEKQARGPVAFVLAAAPPRPILALSGGGRESRKRRFALRALPGCDRSAAAPDPEPASPPAGSRSSRLGLVARPRSLWLRPQPAQG